MVKDHINKMYQHDVIRPSNSSWASPILLVQKKNGKMRFCVDYCKLNKVSIKDAYPLPRMDDIFSVLGKASYYTTIDLTDAFWSIRVREEDIPKTVFIIKYGLWEFISMPFGLTNAPATQQRFIEAVTRPAMGMLFCLHRQYTMLQQLIQKPYKGSKKYILKVERK